MTGRNIASFLIGISSLSFAAVADQGLPSLINSSLIAEGKVGTGHTIKLMGNILFPPEHKFTPAGPSRLTVFEMRKSEWVKIDERSLSHAVVNANGMPFDESFMPKEPTSDLTYDAVIYYCTTNSGGACSLHSFRGTIERKSERGLGNTLAVKLILPPIAVGIKGGDR
jgi:hypothetical protein